VQAQAISTFFHFPDLALGKEADTLMEHGIHEIFTEHRFEIVQEMVAAHDQGNVTAEGMKYPGELHRDVTRTHYGYRARHCFQREETVRGDA
jgi:hypothetical protein